jgi:endonuclease IV
MSETEITPEEIWNKILNNSQLKILEFEDSSDDNPLWKYAIKTTYPNYEKLEEILKDEDIEAVILFYTPFSNKVAILRLDKSGNPI